MKPAIAIGLSLQLAGCTFFSPGCRNRDVRAAIEHDAADAAQDWSRTNAKPGDNFAYPRSFQLKDTYETAASGDTRSCSGKLAASDGSYDVAVPIDYSVAEGENGQPLYGWDKSDFAAIYMQLAINDLYVRMLKGKQPSSPDATTAPPDKAPGADERQAAMRQWERTVHSALAAEAGKLEGMPSGSQVLTVSVSPEGQVSDVRLLGTIVRDPEAMARAESHLRSLTMPKPPDAETKHVTVSLSFR